MPLIDVQGLTRWYDKKKPILKNLEFTLQEKDFCFVMWKSGIGKTTLVKFLMRQLRPPRRKIFHGKDDLSRYTQREVQTYRRNIWVVFQDFKLVDRKTVEQNIAYPLEFGDMTKKEVKQRTSKMITMMWLQSQRNHIAPMLSWWEKQRVAIWRALINDPEFVIADEPTWNLDRESSQMVADLLIQSNAVWNTIVFITHDRELVQYVSSKHATKILEL